MGALPPTLASTLAQLERGLKDLYGDRFRGLLLYGSYARGEADEGSDVDLLVLLDGPVDLSREILRIQPIKWPLGLAADLLLSVFPVSYQAFEEAETAFLSTVRREAVPAAA
jgi:predicted nucleotidyltransferase